MDRDQYVQSLCDLKKYHSESEARLNELQSSMKRTEKYMDLALLCLLVWLFAMDVSFVQGLIQLYK
jgi:hypothetical protein